MKKFAGIIYMAFILLTSLMAVGQVKSVYTIPVTIHQTNKPVSDILNQISRQAGVYFSYDANAIVSERKISVDVTDKPVIDVLNSIFDRSLIRFIEKENQIVISIREEIPAVDPKVEFTTLSGQLIDEKNGENIPFASVSVFNKPIGTITNSDGEFILKVEQEMAGEPIVLSCLGYSQKIMTVKELQQKNMISLHPVSIRIKEIKVNAISPYEILDKVLERIPENYGTSLLMMKAFYRETIKQDDEYINVSEAVINILKMQYLNQTREDKIRIVKGRKSPYVSPFQWVDFKLMGGPANLTQLDVLKNLASFIDPEFRNIYQFNINRVIWYHNHPVFVIGFKPVKDILFPCYQGEMYIDRETYAVLHVNFGFGKQGLRMAEKSLIKKKPARYKVKPERVSYMVDYRYSEGVCYLYSAKASILFKVKNRKENINSEFYSVSELLITDQEKSQIKRFPRNELFSKTDIFTENIDSFDKEFWGNFNILKPDENLQAAIENLQKNNQQEKYIFQIKKNLFTNSQSKKNNK